MAAGRVDPVLTKKDESNLDASDLNILLILIVKKNLPHRLDGNNFRRLCDSF